MVSFGCLAADESFSLRAAPPAAIEAAAQMVLTMPTGPGHAFRKNAAGAFGPDLARKLSQLVKMEKNVMRSMEMVAKERMETAVRGIFLHTNH